MSISLRQKRTFYDQLGQLLRAGVPIPNALDKISLRARGSFRTFLQSLRRQLESGASIGEAFEAARPPLSKMERVTIAGLSRTGKLESGLVQLSQYFEALQTSRSEVIRRLLYPLFLLHFAVLTLNLPLLISAGVDAYLRKTLVFLGIFYLALIVFFFSVRTLQELGATLPPVDDLLRVLPFVGKIRRSFAVSRFCSTYEMQLDAGVNVFESLKAAGEASRSGLIRSLVSRSLPEVRRGEQVGPQLARSRGALPEDVVQGILIAEDTGGLHETLPKLAAEYHQDGLKRIDIASEWIPRFLYLGILGYVAWQIVQAYKGYLGQVDSIMNM